MIEGHAGNCKKTGKAREKMFTIYLKYKVDDR